MDSGYIPSLIAFFLALVFLATGVLSLFTEKNYVKNRNSKLDRIHGPLRFYTCIAFQIAFGIILLFAACRWKPMAGSNHDHEESTKTLPQSGPGE